MWSTLVIAYVLVLFHRISFAIVMDYIIVDFSIKNAAVAGALAGMYNNIYLLMQLPSGILVDKWGPRKTVSGGLFLAGLGTVIFSTTHSLVYAFLGRGLIGLGLSVILLSILKFNIAWFSPGKFSTMAGLLVLLGNIGKATGTTPLAIMVSVFGWRRVFSVIGIATFTIALLCWIIVRDAPSGGHTEYVEERSCNRDSKNNVKVNNQEQIKTRPIEASQSMILGVKNVLTNRIMWYLFIALFGLGGTSFAFTTTWGVYYLMQIYELNRSQAANFLLIMTIGMGIGAPMIGYLSDRFNIRNKLLLLPFLVNVFIWFLMLMWNGKPLELALSFIFFLIGISLAGLLPIFSLAKEVNEPVNSGAAMGIANMGTFAGMSVLQPLQGYILDLRWQGVVDEIGAKVYPLEAYMLIFITCLIIALVSTCFFIKVFKELR